jgi:hypothetical protein
MRSLAEKGLEEKFNPLIMAAAAATSPLPAFPG